MFNIPAGRLRHIIDIQQSTATKDPEFGGDVKAWATVHENVRSEVRAMSGGELVDAKAATAKVEIKIRFRYIPNLTASHRILYAGNAYEFAESPRDIDGYGRWLEVLAIRKEGA